jgi:hypothetical protein
LPTSSLLDARLGVQKPTIQYLPPDVVSLAAAEETIELANAYGVCDGHPLAESQEITLRGALGERADGSWAASRVADFGPRQGTGKNDKIAARELAGLLLFGEKLIIHTAHEFPTANESFLRFAALFENWDDLGKLVEHIYYANGAQAIHLKGGRRILYKTRTGGAGRGFAKADLVVYDEAQHLVREQVAASGPTKLANPNAQTWYAGSGGLATSAVAWKIRREALTGSGGRLAYTEMTGETVTVVGGQIVTVAPDPLDRDMWYRTIPGLGRWVTEEGVEDQYDELGREAFLREIACVWDPEPDAGGSVIPIDAWKSCEDASSKFQGQPVVVVDVTPDRAKASIARAGLRSDGLPHAELVANQPGTAWIIPMLKAATVKPRRILVDASGPAGSLIAEGQAAGVEIEAVSTADHAKACQLLYDLVTQGRMRHGPDLLLEQALAGAVKRDVGDGSWLWSRKNSLVDISPLVAVTIALWAAAEGPKAPAGFKDLADYLDDEE